MLAAYFAILTSKLRCIPQFLEAAICYCALSDTNSSR